MNRKNWTYIGEGGSQINIGIFHVPNKGQVLIYCGKKVVQVDFKVFQDKKYTFFVDEELCSISIQRLPNGYDYHFDIDLKTDTPLNQERKKLNQKNIIYSILTMVGIIGSIALIMWIGNRVYHNKMEASLEKNGVATVGTVNIVPTSNSFLVAYYFNVPQRGVYRKQIEYFESPHPVIDNQMPLSDGDMFYMKYDITEPLNAQIDFSQPTEAQIEKYKAMAVEKFQLLNTDKKPEYCKCAVEASYQANGFEALKDIYYGELMRSDNKYHNRITYENLLKTKAYLDAEENCWQFL